MKRPVVSTFVGCGLVVLSACGGPPPPAPPPPVAEEATKENHTSTQPAMEYDLGSIDPNVAKQRFDALKGDWNDCFMQAHEKNEALSGKITFTIRTNKDGSVKWAFVTHTDLGDRNVERCVLDSVKASNFGAPMDAKEGEIKEKTYGWELDGDEGRPADPGVASNVMPAIEKAKGKLQACRNDAGAQGSFEATIYVAPKGKPKSIGIAVTDPSGDAAVDCMVEVLSKLTYVNKSSYTTKVTVDLP
jgi:hypothetical protein